MKRLTMFFIIALFAAASVAGVKYIAVVETDIDAQSGAAVTLTSADARLVTAELRREAVKNLPRDRYNIMTSETVQSMGGAVLEECAEENCVIALGAKIGADYIVRGTISKFQAKFTLTVEIYETDNGTLMASSEPVRSENVADLLEKAAAACADMYRAFANEQAPKEIAPVPVPEPEPIAAAEAEPKAAAKKPPKPKPAPKPPKPPKPKPAPKPPKVKPADDADVREEPRAVSVAMDLAGSAAFFGAANPAFANEEKSMSARFLFAGALEYFRTAELGFAMPLGLYDAAGLSLVIDGSPRIEVTDGDGNPTGPTAVHQENALALTYARGLPAGLTVGGRAGFIAQTVPGIHGEDWGGNATRFGFGADVGLTYKLLRRYIFGLSMNNIVGAISDTDEKAPAELRFSLLSDFLKRRISYGADFILKDIFAGNEDYMPGYTRTALWEFNNKLGVNIWRSLKLYGLIDFGNDGINRCGFAFGAGTAGIVNIPGIRNIEGMFQFVSIGNDGASEAAAGCVTFFARAEFGRRREDGSAGR